MSIETLNYYTLSLVVGSLTALISGLSVIVGDAKKTENKLWLFLTIATACWSSAYFVMAVADEKITAKLFNLILHYAAILIPILYLVLVLNITKNTREYIWILRGSIILSLLFLSIVHTDSFVADLIPKIDFKFAPVPGPLYIYFFGYFLLLILYGVFICIRTIKKSHSNQEQVKLFYILAFTVVATVGGASMFIPTFFPTTRPYLIFLYPFYPLVCGYAILKYQLFNVKIIAANFVTVCLWVFILIRTLFSDDLKNLILNIILVIVATFFGLFLIKNIKNEAKHREQIEFLLKSVDNLNKKLILADDLKNKFISLATHHIASPLTIIKMCIWSLIEKTESNADLQEELLVAKKATEKTATVIENFIDVIKIERGDENYNIETVYIDSMLDEIHKRKELLINSGTLKFLEIRKIPRRVAIRADFEKIVESLCNIIDNSIKYANADFMQIRIKRSGSFIQLVMSDNMKRIVPKVHKQLREKLNPNNEYEADVLASDLGVFIAKQRVNNHGGNFLIQYSDEDGLNTFIIDLPIAVKSMLS